jgi:tRNA pseudouridine55 synthase
MSGLARDAVLPVDKPEGPTSHDIVAMVRRSLGERRVGHTGTLDPFASGLLLLCVGKATRIAEFLTGMDKSYEAVARLGIATDTLDREGEVVSESDAWRQLEAGDIEQALSGFRGTISQVPPRYSAKKVGGVAAHRMARKGEEVELAPTQVTVRELRMMFCRPPDVGLKIVCSSGTYVRALARDLGSALGVGAHLTVLRRTAVGRFRVEDAVGIEDLSSQERLSERWIRPLTALSDLPRTNLDESALADVRHGRVVPVRDVPDGAPVIATRDDVLAAVGEVREGRFRPRKVFVHA